MFNIDGEYGGNFQQQRLDAAKKRSQVKAKQSFLKAKKRRK